MSQKFTIGGALVMPQRLAIVVGDGKHIGVLNAVGIAKVILVRNKDLVRNVVAFNFMIATSGLKRSRPQERFL